VFILQYDSFTTKKRIHHRVGTITEALLPFTPQVVGLADFGGNRIRGRLTWGSRLSQIMVY